MNILFVADPLEVFKTYKDTTFSMMREAQRRGHRIAACEPRHLTWRSGDVVHAELRDIILTGADEDPWFQVTRTEVRPLKDFDAVLMPYNYFMLQNERYRGAVEEVLVICRERGVAVQLIKTIARGPWATADRTHTTWYQPLERPVEIARALHWAMGVPSAFLNTAGDLSLLPTVLEAAGRYAGRPSDAEMSAMLGAERMTSLFGLPT